MSRDIGLTHGAGKGDAPRYTHNERWEQNFQDIDWGRFEPAGFERRGRRLVKTYPRGDKILISAPAESEEKI